MVYGHSRSFDDSAGMMMHEAHKAFHNYAQKNKKVAAFVVFEDMGSMSSNTLGIRLVRPQVEKDMRHEAIQKMLGRGSQFATLDMEGNIQVFSPKLAQTLKNLEFKLMNEDPEVARVFRGLMRGVSFGPTEEEEIEEMEEETSRAPIEREPVQEKRHEEVHHHHKTEHEEKSKMAHTPKAQTPTAQPAKPMTMNLKVKEMSKKESEDFEELMKELALIFAVPKEQIESLGRGKQAEHKHMEKREAHGPRVGVNEKTSKREKVHGHDRDRDKVRGSEEAHAEEARRKQKEMRQDQKREFVKEQRIKKERIGE